MMTIIKNEISIQIRLRSGEIVNAFQNFYSRCFEICHNGNEYINLPIIWLNDDESCFIDPITKRIYTVV